MPTPAFYDDDTLFGGVDFDGQHIAYRAQPCHLVTSVVVTGLGDPPPSELERRCPVIRPVGAVQRRGRELRLRFTCDPAPALGCAANAGAVLRADDAPRGVKARRRITLYQPYLRPGGEQTFTFRLTRADRRWADRARPTTLRLVARANVGIDPRTDVETVRATLPVKGR